MLVSNFRMVVIKMIYFANFVWEKITGELVFLIKLQVADYGF